MLRYKDIKEITYELIKFKRGETMAMVVFFGGLISGYFLNIVINKFSFMIASKKCTNKFIDIAVSKKNKNYIRFWSKNNLVVLISGLLFSISFLQFGLNVIFIKALALNSILIITSFIDIEHEIIPDKIVVFTLVMGILLSFIDHISFIDAVGGMMFGGGILLLLALVPGVIGGGDIKLTFVLGIFLGFKGIIYAVLLAFITASMISIVLLLLKIKKRKDYIPLGPFLALGSFISFHFINIM